MAKPASQESQPGFPNEASLAALRAWYEGLPARDAVARYLEGKMPAGQSSRGVLGRIRRQLATFAKSRHRGDLAALLEHAEVERAKRGRAVAHAIDVLRSSSAPVPLVTDDVDLWLSSRTVGALRKHGVNTLADLTVRVPRRRRWWPRFRASACGG